MKTVFAIVPLLLSGVLPVHADDALPAEDKAAEHKEGSRVLADDQDELSADVQQLVIEQTVQQVIELLEEVEDIMDETTDRLDGADTGGETIAAQTEIIEKIHAAAKARQSQSSSSSGSAMMDMMERMMGKSPESGKEGEKPGDKGGKGMTGDSDSGNEGVEGTAGGDVEERRVPKAAGTAGAEIPAEFRKAFDAYNRGVEAKLK